MQIQNSNNKDFFCSKKLKLKNQKPVLAPDNMVKLAKKKDKKKEILSIKIKTQTRA